MFRAIGRYLRAIGYLLVGKVDRARQSLTTNPDVVRATYDRVIEEKKSRIHEYKDAVGAMIAQEEKKKSSTYCGSVCSDGTALYIAAAPILPSGAVGRQQYCVVLLSTRDRRLR